MQLRIVVCLSASFIIGIFIVACLLHHQHPHGIRYVAASLQLIGVISSPSSWLCSFLASPLHLAVVLLPFSSSVSSSTALRSCSLHYAVAVRRLSSTSPLGRTVRQLPGFTAMLGIVFVALRLHQLHFDLTIILRPFGFTSSPGSGSPVHRLHRLAWQ